MQKKVEYKIITAADKRYGGDDIFSYPLFLSFISFLTGSNPSPPPKNFIGWQDKILFILINKPLKKPYSFKAFYAVFRTCW